MTAASASPAPEPAAQTRVVGSKVFVRGIQLMAEVGLYAHERGRRQPLILDVELDIGFSGVEHLSDTVNYETIVTAAQAVADEGHIELVELFAERLAQRCLADPRVTRARVRLEKPEALAPRAAGAGVEITLVRG